MSGDASAILWADRNPVMRDCKEKPVTLVPFCGPTGTVALSASSRALVTLVPFCGPTGAYTRQN